MIQPLPFSQFSLATRNTKDTKLSGDDWFGSHAAIEVFLSPCGRHCGLLFTRGCVLPSSSPFINQLPILKSKTKLFVEVVLRTPSFGWFGLIVARNGWGLQGFVAVPTPLRCGVIDGRSRSNLGERLRSSSRSGGHTVSGKRTTTNATRTTANCKFLNAFCILDSRSTGLGPHCGR